MKFESTVPLLQSRAKALARSAGISDRAWSDFIATLEPLRVHHPGMYAHTLRVGVYSHGIAAAEGWSDQRLPFLGGCGHDVGKCEIPVDLLDMHGKPEGNDWVLLQTHPQHSHRILAPQFPVAAMVAGLHHAFQPNAYGVTLQEAPDWLPATLAHSVVEATMVVMIADVFDAMTTRSNASTVVDPSDDAGVAAHLSVSFPDWPNRVKWLTENRIR